MIDLDSQSREVREFVIGWHRDLSGNDVTEYDGVSIGSTLSYMIWHATASILRYAEQMRVTTAGSLYVEMDAETTKLQRLVARELGLAERRVEPISFVPRLDEQVISREMLRIPTSARVVRALQPAVRKRLRTYQNLWVTDWVTFHASRADPEGLSLYRKSLTRSAIPCATSKDIRTSEVFFPEEISNIFNEQMIREFLMQRGFQWSDASVRSISRYVQETYRKIRHLLVMASAQIQNMLNFYDPKKVFLAGDGIEHWNLWYQICNKRDIETTMYMDGYAVVPYFPILRSRDDSRWLVNRIAAYGQGQLELYQRYGFSEKNIDVVYPPFLMSNPKSTDFRNRFDVIVLTWTHNNLNPQSDPFSPASTLIGALTVLVKSGYRKIGVKIRWVGEMAYVRKILEDMDLQAEILQGFFWEYVHSSPLFVGGISTALAEAVGRGARYIVFEPYENGYSDFEISRASVISRKSIARSSDELREMLAVGGTSWVGDPSTNLLM